MAVPIALALAAISLLAAAASAALLGVISVAVRTEDKNHTLTSQPTGTLTRVARRLTGLHVLRCAAHHPS
jgi:hypothetical protein